MRLDKYLLKTNIYQYLDKNINTRRKLKQIINQGLIEVNNQKVNSEKMDVSLNDLIQYQNHKLEYHENIYLMMNKPSGLISATKDNYHQTVLDIINEYPFRELLIVGRLDIDTEGLLIITDDGWYVHYLTAPKNSIPKKYLVHFQGTLSIMSPNMVKEGILLKDGTKTKAGQLEIINAQKAYITLTEGKFHEVKNIFQCLGTKVEYLKRLQIGELSLDSDLKIGSYREMTEDEKKKAMISLSFDKVLEK